MAYAIFITDGDFFLLEAFAAEVELPRYRCCMQDIKCNHQQRSRISQYSHPKSHISYLNTFFPLFIKKFHSATITQKMAYLPSVNTRGISHTTNGENICLSNARKAAHSQMSKSQSFCYCTPKLQEPISRRCELISAMFFGYFFAPKK